MVITGRSISGSSRISTPLKAARPASTIRRFMTTVSTGRRTQSAEMPLVAPARRVRASSRRVVMALARRPRRLAAAHRRRAFRGRGLRSIFLDDRGGLSHFHDFGALAQALRAFDDDEIAGGELATHDGDAALAPDDRDFGAARGAIDDL